MVKYNVKFERSSDGYKVFHQLPLDIKYLNEVI